MFASGYDECLEIGLDFGLCVDGVLKIGDTGDSLYGEFVGFAGVVQGQCGYGIHFGDAAVLSCDGGQTSRCDGDERDVRSTQEFMLCFPVRGMRPVSCRVFRVRISNILAHQMIHRDWTKCVFFFLHESKFDSRRTTPCNQIC